MASKINAIAQYRVLIDLVRSPQNEIIGSLLQRPYLVTAIMISAREMYLLFLQIKQLIG